MTPVARYWDGTAWTDIATPGPAVARVTSLPASPSDGQEVYYVADAANGVLWHLRYNAAGGTYKWEFVGGAELVSATLVPGLSMVGIPATTYTAAQSITVPLAGEYAVAIACDLTAAAGITGSYASLLVNGTHQTAWEAYQGAAAPGSFVRRAKRTFTAADVAALAVRVDVVHGNAQYGARHLSLVPARVG